MRSRDPLVHVVAGGFVGAFAGMLGGLIFGLLIFLILSLSVPASYMGGEFIPVPILLTMAMGWGTLIGGIFGAIVGLRRK
ncbi:hypothetical protein HYW18_03825 [Candidatus Uhrbacteria bacterium]|nr:hypothetical protein [Candidatus Uhrbacteria bacterium]